MKKKKTNKQNLTNSTQEQTYSYEALVDSKRFTEHNWAARAALNKNQKYTLEEADKAVSDYLKKKVVI